MSDWDKIINRRKNARRISNDTGILSPPCYDTQIPVLLLHLLGGLVGYALPRATGFDETSSRTMAIETSMKSSAFGFLLAKLHFGQYAARVPSAVSVVWMALTGSMLAVIWRYIPVKDEK